MPRSSPKTVTIRSLKPLMTMGLAVEARRRIDHPEGPDPGGDPFQAHKPALQAAENGERCELGRRIGLLLGYFGADLAERPGQRPVRIGGPMA